MSNAPEPLAIPSASSGTACCVCGSAEYRPWRRAPDHIMGGWTRYTAVRCARCGTRRLQPRPSAEVMSQAYASTTYARAEGDDATEGLGQRLDGFFERQAERATTAYASYGGNNIGHLLDVGCGDGRFMSSMQRRGWTVEGIEPEANAATLARQRTGATVYETLLEEVPVPPEACQMVSLLHVLEHVPDPRDTLTRAYRLLSPGGMLLLALPNAGSWESSLFGTCWYPLDLPRHYWGFTPRTLVRLVEECGFTVRSVDYFPFLFALQSVRYALRSISGAPSTPPSEARPKAEAGGLRTKLFLSLLNFSEQIGKEFPGEIMELTATR